MNTKEKKLFYDKILFDERLTLAHYKILMYLVDHEDVSSADIEKMFGYKKQFVSKSFRELVNYNYIHITGKIKSTRILLYSLNLEP